MKNVLYHKNGMKNMVYVGQNEIPTRLIVRRNIRIFREVVGKLTLVGHAVNRNFLIKSK